MTSISQKVIDKEPQPINFRPERNEHAGGRSPVRRHDQSSGSPPESARRKRSPCPTASKDVYTTRYGSFISGYAPIDDSLNGSAGNTSAVLGIDIAAIDYTAYMQGKGNAILVLGLASILLTLGCIYLCSCGHSKQEDQK